MGRREGERREGKREVVRGLFSHIVFLCGKADVVQLSMM